MPLGHHKIVGHARALEALARIARSGRVPAALALAGPEGVGKRTAALALFAALNGRPAADPADADLVDVRALAEALAKEGKSASAQIDAVREVKRRLGLATYRDGAWRMVLIDRAEELSEPAANALLKAVEEPPPRTFFALIVENLDRLLPTLRSRATVVRFGPLTDAETAKVIRAAGVAAGDVERVAALAPGRPGLAIARASGEASALRDAVLGGAAAGAPPDLPDRLDRASAAEAAALVVEAARARLRSAPGAAALEALEGALEAAEAIEQGAYAPLALDSAAIRAQGAFAA